MRVVLLALLLGPLVLAGCSSGGGRPHADAKHGSSAKPQPKPRPQRHVAPRRPTSPAARLLGLPPVRRGPVPGYVLIADRNNNRLLIVSPSKRIVWRFAGGSAAGGTFRDPDDAFFTPGYRRIVTNEEFNETIAQIDPKTRKIVWSYGRPGVAGSGSGELSNPDDAYVLPNGDVRVADIQNCRVLRLSPARRIVGEVGTAGACTHDPPRTLLAPNGDTPLRRGGMLVTEIGGYVDRFDAHGRLVYSVRTPGSYPSDAQLLPNGNILVAEFQTPGRVDVITPGGRVVWSYGPASGPGSLDRPSLAVRWPNGMYAVTDDWHHRVVVINPGTKRIVWQYGHFGVASARRGYLSKPDGLDLLPAGFVAARPRSPSARARSSVAPSRSPHGTVSVTRIGVLPEATSRLAVATLPNGRLVAAGGLVGGTSSSQILAGPPSHLRVIGRLPVPGHDAGAALVGSSVYVFGGGQSVSSDRIVRIDAASGSSRAAGSIGEPLSDLGAVALAGRAYLVGGYTGSRFATAVLRFTPGSTPTTVARLPAGLRYAGVATLGDTIYVAGGLTESGESRAVFAVDPSRGRVRRVATLPSPVAHAPLASLNGSLYLIGGTSSAGTPLTAILRIDPKAGTVTRVGALPRPTADAAAVTVGRSIVVLGGAGAEPSRAVYALTP